MVSLNKRQDILESVFLALIENVVVFKAEGKADNTHFLVLFIVRAYYMPLLAYIPSVRNSTIYLCMGFTTTFDWIKKLPHTFFL